MYIPLHVHYNKGSIGDSILKIKDAVEKAKELKIFALSVTEHGSLNSCVEFYKECIDNNIKPLIGCEIYECDDRTKQVSRADTYHMVLLAKNKQGYEDLLHISADSQLVGFYYEPRSDMSVLEKYGNNLICLSACVGGRIPKLIKKYIDSKEDDKLLIYDEITSLITKYKTIFADFYLEIQPGDFDLQIQTNLFLVELAELTNTELVITNDVHYLNCDDFIEHSNFLKISKKNIEYPDSCYYLMSEQDVIDRFNYIDKDIIERALNNTVEIANSINLDDLYDKNIKFPVPQIPEQFNENEYLIKICYENFNKIKHKIDDPSIYIDRLNYELDTLKEVGFSGYMLVVKDIVDYANNNNIPLGPGRGSIGGSLVAYVLNIVAIDPIKYNLMFERFISRFRKGTVPDVDLDIATEYRESMFEYVMNKYGKDYCSLVSTYQIRHAKTSIRDTARFHNISLNEADRVAKLIPTEYYSENGDDGVTEKEVDLSIKRSIEVTPELKVVYDDLSKKEWIDSAMLLESSIKSVGTHASGILISPTPLENCVPLIRTSKKCGILATSLTLEDAEYTGVIKYDFLGNATLQVIYDTVDELKINIDLNDDDFYDDLNVWQLIGSKHTTTLFQIGSYTYKSRMWRLCPNTIIELANCLALLRGPCLSAKLDNIYIEIIEGKREVELLHPFYDSVTAYSNGVLLYQEDLMKILVNWGYSLEDSFKVMKLASKKKNEKLKKEKENFDILSVKNNIDKNTSDRVWKIILDMGKYAFNSSHSVAYATFCYFSAYLKTHYPLQWMANAITNVYQIKKDDSVIEETIIEAKRIGIEFLPLDINKSKWKFTVEDEKIRIGFVAVKGIGRVAYDSLQNQRDIKSIESLDDLMTRKNIGKFNKTAFIASIFSGAFDDIENCTDRVSFYEQLCLKRRENVLTKIVISKNNDFNTSDELDVIEKVLFRCEIINDIANRLDGDNLLEVDNCDCTVQAIIKRVKTWTDKKGNEMAFILVRTNGGDMDCTVFASLWNKDIYTINRVIDFIAEKKNDKLLLKQLLKYA